MKTKRLLTALLFVGGVISASATDYYVSPNGAGTKDGTSVDTPMSCADFVAMFDTADEASAIANKSSVYFAAGTYLITSPLYIQNGLYLYGNTGEGRTVFSGNLDGSDKPKANTGDLSCFFNIETNKANGNKDKEVIINDIDFDVLYFSQNGEGKAKVGALFVENSGYVEVNRCSFTNLVNTGEGGNALLSRRSMVNFYDCIFTDNSAQMKGVIARLLNTDTDKEKGYTTFERCLISNNRITGNSSYDGGMIYFQSGMKLTLKTCVVRDNISGGQAAAIWDANEPKQYHNRALEITNTLMYNNTSPDNTNILLHASNTSVPVNSVIHDDTSVSGAINISSVGVGTYYLSLPFKMPEGVTGKTISGAADGKLTIGETYSAGDVVPAGTALLVEGSEGSYAPFVAESNLSAPDNLLKGSDGAETTTGGDKYYKLANDATKGLGFYWAVDGGAAFTNGAHKAYLALTGAKARFFSLDFDSETTGISTATTKAIRQGKFVENGSIVIVRNGIKYNAQGIKL